MARAKTNEAFLGVTLKTASGIVDTAVQQAEKCNVPRSATMALLTQAEGLFDGMAKYGHQTRELRYRKAWMLISVLAQLRNCWRYRERKGTGGPP